MGPGTGTGTGQGENDESRTRNQSTSHLRDRNWAELGSSNPIDSGHFCSGVFTMTLQSDLINTVRARKALEAEIKEIKAPYEEILTEALGSRPEILKQIKGLEIVERAEVAKGLTQAFSERNRLLQEGVEVPPVPLAEGLTVKWVDALEVGDYSVDTVVKLFTAGLLKLDETKILKAIKGGLEIEGLTLTKKVQLVVK
jgi:hypothetical protein